VIWKGKYCCERVAVVMIVGMGVTGICCLWLPIEWLQYGASLEEGECQLYERRWIAYCWVVGDTVISLLLLILFIRPLRHMKANFVDSPRSIAILYRMIRKNRNLLLFTVLFTLVIISTAAIKYLDMRTVIYLLAVDRLVTLQCITMTFSMYAMEFSCHNSLISCWKSSTPERENFSSDPEFAAQNLKSLSLIRMAPACSSTEEDGDTTPCTFSGQTEPGFYEKQGFSSLS